MRNFKGSVEDTHIIMIDGKIQRSWSDQTFNVSHNRRKFVKVA